MSRSHEGRSSRQRRRLLDRIGALEGALLELVAATRIFGAAPHSPEKWRAVREAAAAAEGLALNKEPKE